MKKIILLLLFLILIFFISAVSSTEKLSFRGYLEKNEKVEIRYFFGLKNKIIEFDNLKNDELAWHDNYPFFNIEIDMPRLLNRQNFTLKYYKNNNCVFDSTYMQKNKYPIYLIGVLHPSIYKKMLSNGDNLINYKFYFKTKQDDIELENELKKLQD